MKFQPRSWVSWGLAASFLLTILTGLVISYPFREEMPLLSTVGIEGVIPFGALFRYLHYYAAQFTFLFLFWHTTEALWARSYQRRHFFHWFLLTSTYPLTILALFTGYIVRGDETGLSAGRIAENLILTLPFFGKILNRLFFAVSEEGIHRAYITHIFLSFVLFFLLGIWHFRLRKIKLEDLSLWATGALALSLLWPPPLEAPHFQTSLKGPWFFLGIQELLRYLPPFGAGIIFPLIPIILLVFFPRAPKRAGWGLLLWHLFYFALLGRGLLR